MAYPGGRNLNLIIYRPSSQHHPFGPPRSPPTPGPSLGRLGPGSGEGGGIGRWNETQSWTPVSEASSAGPGAAALSDLNCCPF